MDRSLITVQDGSVCPEVGEVYCVHTIVQTATRNWVLIVNRISHHVRAKVNTENGDRSEGKRNAGYDKQQERCKFWYVGSQRVGDGLL